MSIYANQYRDAAIEAGLSGVNNSFVHNLFTHLNTLDLRHHYIEIRFALCYNNLLCYASAATEWYKMR